MHGVIVTLGWQDSRYDLGPMVTDGNKKSCCRGFILTLFQSITANKIESEHTREYKLFPVYEVEILRYIRKKLKFSHLFMLISNTFSRK